MKKKMEVEDRNEGEEKKEVKEEEAIEGNPIVN